MTNNAACVLGKETRDESGITGRSSTQHAYHDLGKTLRLIEDFLLTESGNCPKHLRGKLWQELKKFAAAVADRVSGVGPDSPKHPEAVGLDPASSPSSATQPAELASGAAVMGKGRQLTPRTTPKTVRNQLAKLGGNLYGVIVDLKGFKNSPQALQNPDRREDREHAITVLEAAMKQITRIVASFGVPGAKSGDGSTSVGNLPFTTATIVRGSSFKRVHHISEIVAAVASRIQESAPTVAAELENVAGELEHVLERARPGGCL